MKTRRLAAAVALCLVLLTSHAILAGVTKRLSFKAGASSGAVSGGVIRGERDTWLVGAAKGQIMTVKITSVEDNAVFQIYTPQGTALKGADAGDDAKEWSGTLPARGDYKVVVGGTRGNCTYQLKVKIQ